MYESLSVLSTDIYNHGSPNLFVLCPWQDLPSVEDCPSLLFMLGTSGGHLWGRGAAIISPVLARTKIFCLKTIEINNDLY